MAHEPKHGPADREMRDGYADGFVPLEVLDLQNVGDMDDLMQAMAKTAFGGRRLGEAADVLEAMVTDPECCNVLTLSGAMTVAKMNLVITEMVERGWIQAIISTGALMTHGLVELAGMSHFKAAEGLDDKILFERGYNRIYDTYEPEANLNNLAKLVVQVFDKLPLDARVGSRHLLALIGQKLSETKRPRGLVTTCWQKGVPIYIPALSDSELGLDLATFSVKRRRAATGESPEEALTHLHSVLDPMLDLGHYARFISKAPRIGIFTIGGGVPRNWAQQAPPFIDIMNEALGTEVRMNRFRYGVRICPEPVHWGGLSGCTYSEGVSWGKFVDPKDGGRFAEVLSDATIAWPILIKAVAQRLDKKGVKAASPALGLEGYEPKWLPEFAR